MQLYYCDRIGLLLFILLMLFILLAGANISDKKLSCHRETARQLRCACLSRLAHWSFNALNNADVLISSLVVVSTISAKIP